MKNLSLSTLLALSFLTVACSKPSGSYPSIHTKSESSSDNVNGRVIYGEDNRRDIYEITDTATLARARSTAALINNEQLRLVDNNHYEIATSNFGADYNLCTTERFREQDAAAFCSGFLAAPNILVTAGHCVRSENECHNTSFVFDYAVTSAGGTGPRQTPVSNVYACNRLIRSQVVSRGADYAVIQLDRPVTGRTPLALRRTGRVSVHDPLVVIGHPAGIPTKVAGGANVRALDNGFFLANLDTYGGNSGSAVFNANTGEVEGILVRGETDFAFQGNCRVSKVCENAGCRGEDATYISEVLPYITQNARREVKLGFSRRWRSGLFY